MMTIASNSDCLYSVQSNAATSAGARPILDGDTMRIHFDRFTLDDYRLFLRIKSLPEYEVSYHSDSESYTVSAPARFAGLLGLAQSTAIRPALPFPDWMFDDQVAIVQMAIDAKRYACWSDCGLGKTVIQLEFARQVVHRTGGRVLIFTLNEIVQQTIDEAQRFYGDELTVVRLSTRQEMREWCRQPGPGIAITNYEKMNPDDSGQVVNELRYLAGVILDESSRLKGGGGKQKWALIHSCKGIEYKLSCTATPAPNDTIEFASQASFLEKMRSDGEIIWTYFTRDPKSQEWKVKRHARGAFFEFMSAWSIYVRDPRRYGWRKSHPDIPAPRIVTHDLRPTPEQVEALKTFCTDKGGQMSLLQRDAANAIQRGKLSQLAKGFYYLKGQQGNFHRLPSRKPRFVAGLAESEIKAGLQTLIWTVFDAESTILAEELKKNRVDFDLLTGRTAEEDRIAILERFRRGESRCLVTRASMVGYGQNFQQCGSMIFSGWNDSYEAFYQAVRRAYRYGQTRSVRVHLPVIECLEGDMLENIFAKQEKHEAAIAEMEANYIGAMKRMRLASL